MRVLVACAVFLSANLPAQTGGMELSVDGGGRARAWEPVVLEVSPSRVPVATPHGLTVVLASGEELPAQVEDLEEGSMARRRIAWVQPALTGESRVRVQPASAAAAGFGFVEGEGFRDLRFDGVAVLRHVRGYDPERHDATARPYHHVFRPEGESFLTKGLGGLYPHHRGLFVGWNQTRRGEEAWDFWHCREGVSIRHRCDVKASETVGPVYARSVSEADWCEAGGVPVVRERRTVTVWRQPAGRRLIDFDFELASAKGRVELRGDPQHAGFQFRADQTVAPDHATYLRPTSARHTGNDVWKDCDWAVCRFELGGRDYAVAHFDHSDNPRPTVYSTRAYGRFGSFGEHVLEPGKPLRLRYRILVLERPRPEDLDAGVFADLYASWTRPIRAACPAGDER